METADCARSAETVYYVGLMPRRDQGFLALGSCAGRVRVGRAGIREWGVRSEIRLSYGGGPLIAKGQDQARVGHRKMFVSSVGTAGGCREWNALVDRLVEIATLRLRCRQENNGPAR